MHKLDNTSSSLLGLGVGFFILSLNLKRYLFFEATRTLTILKIFGACLIIVLSVALWLKSNKKPQHNIVYGGVCLVLAIFVSLFQWEAFTSNNYNWLTLVATILAILFLITAGLMQLKKD